MNDDKYNHKCKVSMSVIPRHNETVDYIRGFWEPVVDWLEIWKPHNWTDGRDYRKVSQKKKTCGRPFSGPIQIQSDGKMIVCCFDYNGVLTVGDTHKESIADILKGKKFNEIRRKHESGDLTGLICLTCDQLNEGNDQLLYSSIDKNINRTFYTKHDLEEVRNGVNTN